MVRLISRYYIYIHNPRTNESQSQQWWLAVSKKGILCLSQRKLEKARVSHLSSAPYSSWRPSCRNGAPTRSNIGLTASIGWMWVNLRNFEPLYIPWSVDMAQAWCVPQWTVDTSNDEPKSIAVRVLPISFSSSPKLAVFPWPSCPYQLLPQHLSSNQIKGHNVKRETITEQISNTPAVADTAQENQPPQSI